MEWFINRGHGFQHHGGYIQDDKYNDEYIDDLIPMRFTDDFGVQQAVNFFFGCVLHIGNLIRLKIKK